MDHSLRQSDSEYLMYLPESELLLKMSLTLGCLPVFTLTSMYPTPSPVTSPWVVITCNHLMRQQDQTASNIGLTDFNIN